MKKRFIPTINISPILDENFTSKKSKDVVKKIENACLKIGFFQVVGHGINLKQIQNICKIGNNFFKKNDKIKLKLAPKKWNKKSGNVYRGYFPNDVNGKEGLDIGDLKVSKKYSKRLKNQYIEYLNLNIAFSKRSIIILKNYYDSAFLLSEILFKTIIKSYNKDVRLSKKVFSRYKTLSTLRFNYYANQNKPVEISKQDGIALGCETHVDSGIFTVLYQDKRGGLQVQNRKNKKWYNVSFNKNALVINTGRALEFLTEGKFKATNHRVLWNKKERMSIPFFFEPSYDYKMSKDLLKKGISNDGIMYEKFLNSSLKKFIEYKR